MQKLYFALSFLTATAVGAEQRKTDEKGATAVEYGLLVALIAAVIIAAVIVLGTRVNVGFGKVNDLLPST